MFHYDSNGLVRNFKVFHLMSDQNPVDVICVPFAYSGGNLGIKVLKVIENSRVEIFSFLTINLNGVLADSRLKVSGSRAYLGILGNDDAWIRSIADKIGSPVQVTDSEGVSRPLVACSNGVGFIQYHFDLKKLYE